MDATLSHTTAFWLLVLLHQQTSLPGLRATGPSGAGPAGQRPHDVPLLVKDVQHRIAIATDGGRIEKLDILYNNPASRSSASSVRSHTLNAQIDSAYLIDLGGGALLSGPELCFLEMANQLSRTELALLGYELCGGYAMADCEEGFVNHLPMTTVAKIRQFLNTVPGAHGVQKARSALSMMLENSNSPMESRIAMLLSSPKRMGGYGVAAPKLNAKFTLSSEASRLCGCPYYKLDLYWRRIKHCLEYKGGPYHEGIARDAQRELALMHDGVRVRSLTYEQAANQTQFREIVRELHALLGERMRPPSRQAIDARRTLVDELYPRRIPLADGREGFPTMPWVLPASFANACDSPFKHR